VEIHSLKLDTAGDIVVALLASSTYNLTPLSILTQVWKIGMNCLLAVLLVSHALQFHLL
jgi:hypothetical protein